MVVIIPQDRELPSLIKTVLRCRAVLMPLESEAIRSDLLATAVLRPPAVQLAGAGRHFVQGETLYRARRDQALLDYAIHLNQATA